MLPHPYHLPPAILQFSVYFLVAIDVATDLGFPELGVGGRFAVALGAAVPEAAVDEEGDAELGEHEVRFAGKRPVAAPALDAVFAEEPDHALFSAGVPLAANVRHHLAPLP